MTRRLNCAAGVENTASSLLGKLEASTLENGRLAGVAMTAQQETGCLLSLGVDTQCFSSLALYFPNHLAGGADLGDAPPRYQTLIS